MDAVWSACDVFWEFDCRHTGQITRAEYIQVMQETPNVTRLRFQRLAKLDSRFRSSTIPLTLKEYLRLIWPAATQKDEQMMHRWAQLREAWHIVNKRDFRAMESELSQVFGHLDGQ